MIQIQGDFFTGGCYRGLVGFTAPRLMAFPEWDLLCVLTPELILATPPPPLLVTSADKLANGASDLCLHCLYLFQKMEYQAYKG